MHSPPPGYPLLRRCNQASNQLGKLTAGVSYFLLLPTKPGHVNSAFPRSPGLLHLSFFFQMRKGLNYEKAEKFLVTLGMLC